MNYKWLITSAIVGFIGALLAYIIGLNVKQSIVIFVIITIIVLINNPNRRYMKAFWIIFSLIIALNRFSYELVGQIFGIDLNISSGFNSDIISILLILLAGLSLILDYRWRRDNSKDPLKSITNRVLIIFGRDINIHQEIDNK